MIPLVGRGGGARGGNPRRHHERSGVVDHYAPSSVTPGPLLVTVALVLLAVVILKVGVVAGLLGRNTTGGIVHQHHLQEVETCIVKVVAQGRRKVTIPLGEGSLKVWIRRHSGPDIFGGGAEQSVQGRARLARVELQASPRLGQRLGQPCEG